MKRLLWLLPVVVAAAVWTGCSDLSAQLVRDSERIQENLETLSEGIRTYGEVLSDMHEVQGELDVLAESMEEEARTDPVAAAQYQRVRAIGSVLQDITTRMTSLQELQDVVRDTDRTADRVLRASQRIYDRDRLFDILIGRDSPVPGSDEKSDSGSGLTDVATGGALLLGTAVAAAGARSYYKYRSAKRIFKTIVGADDPPADQQPQGQIQPQNPPPQPNAPPPYYYPPPVSPPVVVAPQAGMPSSAPATAQPASPSVAPPQTANEGTQAPQT